RWRGEKRKAMPKHRRAFSTKPAYILRATLRAERFCPVAALLLLDDALASPASKRLATKQNRFRYRLWGFLRWVLQCENMTISMEKTFASEGTKGKR
ncbi:hypothetical protein, partial [Hydrogenimonas sp.]